MNQFDDLQQGLRQGMRALASGVCVVSATGESGERCAMTASSVTSVSNEPPSLLVCVNQSARMDFVLSTSTLFSVNVLAASQQDVSEICATPDAAEERFNVGGWQPFEESGLYYLNDSPAVFVCEKANSMVHGTHTIYVANIKRVLTSVNKQPVLLYADGGYHALC